MKKAKILAGTPLLSLFICLSFFATGAFADTIQVDDPQLDDPATLHTGYGTKCATGGCPVFGKEVNGFSDNSFDISQTSGGAGALVNPWLLILGVPNQNNASLFDSASISNINGKTPAHVLNSGTPADTFGNGGTALDGWSGDGYAGSMTSGDEVYSFLKLQGKGLDNSNSFTNWAAADSKVLNINASSFGIYVFDIKAPLSGSSPSQVNFAFSSGSLPQGTFIVAYGNDGKHVYVDPFTEAGLEEQSSPVPEPGSMLLLGTGLSLLAARFNPGARPR